jgi:hypothetical protein
MPAHGAAGRRIGIDAITVVLHGRNVVQAVDQRTGVKNGDDAVAAIGAAALHHLAFAGGDTTIPGHADLHARVAFRATAMGEDGFLARELHAHGAAGCTRKEGNDDLEVECLDAGTEAAADIGLDDAHA